MRLVPPPPPLDLGVEVAPGRDSASLILELDIGAQPVLRRRIDVERVECEARRAVEYLRHDGDFGILDVARSLRERRGGHIGDAPALSVVDAAHEVVDRMLAVES